MTPEEKKTIWVFLFVVGFVVGPIIAGVFYHPEEGVLLQYVKAVSIICLVLVVLGGINWFLEKTNL